jgi:putative membrane protein
MNRSPSWLSRDLIQPAAVAAVAACALAHSLRTRGLRRSAVFVALGLGLPALGEHHAVRVQRSLRHHMQPQVRGVPLPALLGWYGITYATYALSGSILEGRKRSGRRADFPTPVMTALLATDLDLLLDAYGLDRGLWEWRDGGPYAAEIAGANGQRGVPLANFAGWIVLTGAVTALYERLAGDPVDARSEASGRAAAVLLLPYYLLPALWALPAGKTTYLLFANPFAAALVKGLRGWTR